ncbi:hypothetical protein GCM10010412_099610 [Nonomuraea recticatena]|uniref:DUF5753 domain-containing protein n=1 Tax=Nonomuraea recticatena TaxID=46178 RepID=A0ABP6FVJ7_9ACTN
MGALALSPQLCLGLIHLVDALHMQASAAVLHDPDVRAYYQQLRGRDIAHNAALRQIAKPARRHPARLSQKP